MKSLLYFIGLLATLCPSAQIFAQGFAPPSLNGLTLTYTVLGGNGVRVAPNIDLTLSTAGSGRAAYTEAGFADLGPTGIIQGGFGSYTYAASGNVGHQVQVGQNVGIPTVPLVSTITFVSPFEGTWTQAWGNASNFGTFVAAPTSPTAPLLNIATRIDLVVGQSVTPGFVVGGPISRKVLVRAVGPGLAPFGVSRPIPTTSLSIFSGSKVVATNTGWTSAAADIATLQNTFASVGAFALPPGSKDSAVLLTLAPGDYTATAGAAAANDSGTILVEVYFIP